MISESTNPKNGSAQAVDAFQIWLRLFLCMTLLSIFFAYAAQTRVFSPLLDNFLLSDAYTWVDRLDIVDGVDGPESEWWSSSHESELTLLGVAASLPDICLLYTSPSPRD